MHGLLKVVQGACMRKRKVKVPNSSKFVTLYNNANANFSEKLRKK